MLEIVARLDALGPAERSIVVIDPGFHGGAVFERDGGPGARVQAGLRIAGAVAFELVEGAERRKGIGQIVDLSGDTADGRRHGSRIDDNFEEN